MRVFTIVLAAIAKYLSAEIVIGETFIVPAVAQNLLARHHCAGPALDTVRHAEVASLTPLVSIGSARANNKK